MIHLSVKDGGNAGPLTLIQYTVSHLRREHVNIYWLTLPFYVTTYHRRSGTAACSQTSAQTEARGLAVYSAHVKRC